MKTISKLTKNKKPCFKCGGVGCAVCNNKGYVSTFILPTAPTIVKIPTTAKFIELGYKEDVMEKKLHGKTLILLRQLSRYEYDYEEE